MKSLFKPEQPMRQSELFGIVLAPAVWLLWILFLNGTARLPEGGFAGLLTAEILFCAAFLWLFPAMRRQILNPAASLHALFPQILAAIAVMLFATFRQFDAVLHLPELPLRFSGLCFSFVILNGLVAWNCLDLIHRLEPYHYSRRGAPVAIALLHLFLWFPLLFGGAVLARGLFSRQLNADNPEKRQELRQRYSFILTGAVLFWFAFWLNHADFFYTAETGIRYQFSGNWLLVLLPAAALNLWVVVPMPFLLLRRFGWPVAWGMMSMVFLAYGVRGFCYNRPDSYLLADFGRMDGSVRLQAMSTIRPPGGRFGGTIYVFSGDILRFAESQAKMRRMKFNERLSPVAIPPQLNPAEMQKARQGWGDPYYFIYPVPEKNRVYIRIFR